tara:strand:+ start:339 stop:446 length:108 start_codon:yes stop_codon:yes gene_type:complete
MPCFHSDLDKKNNEEKESKKESKSLSEHQRGSKGE